jgi:hypothetical protein
MIHERCRLKILLDYMRKSMTIVRHAFFIGQKGILGGFKELIMVRILY